MFHSTACDSRITRNCTFFSSCVHINTHNQTESKWLIRLCMNIEMYRYLLSKEWTQYNTMISHNHFQDFYLIQSKNLWLTITIKNLNRFSCINYFYSVLIGAPRAQSTLANQRNINETGAIYKCRFDKSANEKCVPFVFDPWGNIRDHYNQYTYENEMKDYQWMGASMDGSANDNEKFVVSKANKHLKQCTKKPIIINQSFVMENISGVCTASYFWYCESLFDARYLLLDNRYIVRQSKASAKNSSTAFQRQTNESYWWRSLLLLHVRRTRS